MQTSRCHVATPEENKVSEMGKAFPHFYNILADVVEELEHKNTGRNRSGDQGGRKQAAAAGRSGTFTTNW